MKADEGGVSFWVPGFFGSLAAAPQQPGWSQANIYYHTNVSAGGDEMQGYLNFKGYNEFAAENRPDGWNKWVTFVISPAAPPASAPRRMVAK